MNIFGTIKNTLSLVGGKASLLFKKCGPTTMTVVGVGGVVATVVIACVATTKAEPILDKTKERIDKAKENEDSKAQSKEIAVAYGKAAIDFAKLYAPAATVGTISIAMILGSHHILKKENAALMAMTSALSKSFAEYRKRVVEDAGEDKDLEYYHGIKKTTKVIVDPETGDQTTETTYVQEKPSVSIYSKIFDKLNDNWTSSASMNLMFLRGIQDEMNYILKIKGHVFLNEVYDRLGFPRTYAGQFVGWVYGGNGDNKIDFGIYDITDKMKTAFVNGWEPSIMLDFNVDGDIMYILKKNASEEAKDMANELENCKEYLRNQ